MLGWQTAHSPHPHPDIRARTAAVSSHRTLQSKSVSSGAPTRYTVPLQDVGWNSKRTDITWQATRPVRNNEHNSRLGAGRVVEMEQRQVADPDPHLVESVAVDSEWQANWRLGQAVPRSQWQRSLSDGQQEWQLRQPVPRDGSSRAIGRVGERGRSRTYEVPYAYPRSASYHARLPRDLEWENDFGAGEYANSGDFDKFRSV